MFITKTLRKVIELYFFLIWDGFSQLAAIQLVVASVGHPDRV
jgi:hypothetical protein